MTKCFYHIDNDGKCAGAIVKSVYTDAKCIPIDYDIPFPLDSIELNEWVFIVDFSIEPESMKKLLKVTSHVCWIDHHISSIEKYAGFKQEIDGIREVGKSGCLLTWEWFYPHEPPSIAVQLINDWDIWANKMQPQTDWFGLGLGMLDNHPKSSIWPDLLHNRDPLPVENICADGKIIKEYQDKQNESFMKNYGYATEFMGYTCFVANLPKPSSKAFTSIADKYDVFIGYVHKGDVYVFSIYTDNPDIDVRKIAEAHSGGGHKGAAGWHSPTIPFTPIDGEDIDSKLEEAYNVQ